MQAYEFAVYLNAFASWTMLGVILVIHFIHYPMFLVVKESEWPAFHTKHTQVLGAVAGPLMLLELAVSIVLVTTVTKNPAGVWGNFVLVIALWYQTFFKSVPAHTILASKQDVDQIEVLLKSNLVRVWLWCLKAFFAVF